MFHQQLNSAREALLALLLLGAPAAQAQSPPAEKTRLLTIDEVVRMALTNNLDILISQFNPQIDQFAVNGLYGAYEPNLFHERRAQLRRPRRRILYPGRPALRLDLGEN